MRGCLTISIKTFQKNLYLGTQDLFPKEELRKKYKIRFLPEMSKKLVYLRNRISKTICKNLVADFENKI